MAHVGPSFTLPAACVTTLSTPADFYAALLTGVRASAARATLSSLYLGTGALEVALVDELRAALAARPSLR